MLQFVSADLWRWNDSIHFAVMPITQMNKEESIRKAKELKSELGVEVVFYEEFDGSHTGLKKVIEEIAHECPDIPDHRKGGLLEGELEGAEETKTAIQTVERTERWSSSSWIESVNKRMEIRVKTNED
jgi:hypothetical protein